MQIALWRYDGIEHTESLLCWDCVTLQTHQPSSHHFHGLKNIDNQTIYVNYTWPPWFESGQYICYLLGICTYSPGVDRRSLPMALRCREARWPPSWEAVWRGFVTPSSWSGPGTCLAWGRQCGQGRRWQWGMTRHGSQSWIVDMSSSKFSFITCKKK